MERSANRESTCGTQRRTWIASSPTAQKTSRIASPYWQKPILAQVSAPLTPEAPEANENNAYTQLLRSELLGVREEKPEKGFKTPDSKSLFSDSECSSIKQALRIQEQPFSESGEISMAWPF